LGLSSNCGKKKEDKEGGKDPPFFIYRGSEREKYVRKKKLGGTENLIRVYGCRGGRGGTE